jgi:hypothetical protein
MLVNVVYLNVVVKRRILIVFKHWISYEGKLNDISVAPAVHKERLEN